MSSKYPSPPYHSCDPVDWAMYSDILQDAGASRSLWRPPQLVAESLHQSTRVWLVGVPKFRGPYLPGECSVVRTHGFFDFIAGAWAMVRPYLAWVPLRQNCYLGFGLTEHQLHYSWAATAILSTDGSFLIVSGDTKVKTALREKNPQKVVSAFFAAHARRAFGRWELF